MELQTPIPPNQGWNRGKATETRHFPILDFGGRGGINFTFILSKIVALDIIRHFSCLSVRWPQFWMVEPSIKLCLLYCLVSNTSSLALHISCKIISSEFTLPTQAPIHHCITLSNFVGCSWWVGLNAPLGAWMCPRNYQKASIVLLSKHP